MGFLRSSSRRLTLIFSHTVRNWPYSALVLLIPLFLVFAVAEQNQAKQGSKESAHDSLQEHYDAARTFQLTGDQEQAATEYKIFLAEALRQIADARTRAGEFDFADKLFSEALVLTPETADVSLDYAALRLQQGNAKEAQSLAERAVKLAPDNAQAQYMLGSALFQQQDYAGAKEHLEKAVVADAKFEIGYLLGITYIKLNDLNRATLLFNEMVVGLGDTPQIHVLFGRAYREGDYLDQAIEELRKAIKKDSKIKVAHYLAAMAYLERDGDSGFDRNQPPRHHCRAGADAKVSLEKGGAFPRTGRRALWRRLQRQDVRDRRLERRQRSWGELRIRPDDG